MKKSRIQRMALVGIMSAISIVLNYFSFNLGTMKITLYALPIMIVGFLYGPLLGGFTGLISGFISQLTSQYGLTITSPLWMLAPIFWGFVSGFIMNLFKKDYKLFKVIVCVLITSISALIINSIAMIVDGIVFEYPYEYVFTMLGYRILAMLITGIIYIVLLYIISNRLVKFVKGRKK